MKYDDKLHTAIREKITAYDAIDREILFVIVSIEAMAQLILELESFSINRVYITKYMGLNIYESPDVEYYKPVIVLKQ